MRSPVRRRGIIALVVLVVVAALLFAADRGVQALAERRLAADLQSTIGSAQRPAVDLGRFPFLDELATSQVRTARVQLDSLALPNGNGATATDVDATFSDVVVSDRFSRAVARRGDATGLLSYDSLSSLSGLRISYLEPERVSIDFSVPVGRLMVEGTAKGRPVLDVTAQALTIEDGDITVPGAEDDEGVVEAAGQLVLRRPYALGDLPYDLQLTALTVTESGLRFAASAENVPLR